ncbi:hypothetical protein [Curtobacterium sp. MCSS17_007]|uniref:hypothetical protein n=1 Tax=Curtobacterium sp. MCSS17_007 TaxID=2175646 RepID=UPI000DAA520A|nr:hypothetical protein [Curtobacterium sp. MCSS17_007]WIE74501.1 hypothetical protein DEJ22_009420 [Curtobacterium sp. MCSS17_007]
MTDDDHFAVNAWMIGNGFKWEARVHPDGGVWRSFHPDVGNIELTQAAAVFAFFQYLKGGRQGAQNAADLVPQRLNLRQALYAILRMGRPRA